MSQKKDNKQSVQPGVIKWLCGAVILTLLAYFYFFIINLENYLNVYDGETTAHLGDTINGLTAPFIAILIAYLTYKAFIVQYDFNRKQRNDIRRERFENKFYELISLHKENLHETRIKGYKDRIVEERKAFVSMYKELRFTYFVVEDTYNKFQQMPDSKVSYNKQQLLKLAYIFFYFGVGTHSNMLNESSIGKQYDEAFWKEIRSRLFAIHLKAKTLQKYKPISITVANLGTAMLPKSYRPFSGHMSRLAHYYRHLYQTVDFVVSADKLSPKRKMSYLKTVRAQLSDHEQTLLYYNAVSGFGYKWVSRGFFTDYRIIHNLPLPLVHFGPTVEDALSLNNKAGKFYNKEDKKPFFEWQEVGPTMK